MKSIVVVWFLGAACGGSKPESTSLSNGSAAPQLRCKVVVERASEHVKLAAKDVTMAIGQCEQLEWTGDARECVAGVHDDKELAACGTKFVLGKAGIFQSHIVFDDAMKAMEKFRDQFCACTDSACATKVSDELTKWSQEMAKNFEEPPRMTEAETKRAAEIGEQMGKCMQKAMGGSTTP